VVSDNPRDKTVVLAGGIWFGCTTFGIGQGLRRLGWDVHEIDMGQFFPQYRSRWLRAIRRVVRPLAVRDYNEAIVEAVRAEKPRAFVTVKGEFVKGATLQEIADLGVARANYYPDYRFSYPGVDEATFSLYSHFFSTKSFQIPYLSNKLGVDKVTHLPHGYQPDAHRPPDDSLLQCRPPMDILYVGSHTPWKEAWLAAVKRRFPHLQFRVYGNGWRKNADVRLFQDAIVGLPITGTAYARAIRSARITLAIHMGPSGTDGWQDLVSTRTFEIPACKGFMLHIDNEEVRQFFTPGKEIDVFATKEELFEKIEFYLKHDSLREAMIERAYARCVPVYSYDERARVIAEWIERSQECTSGMTGNPAGDEQYKGKR